MTSLENYQLAHPELLTEDALLQVLRDRCIEVPRLKSTDKTELVEIFKRVALPLPQRSYDGSTYLGRKLISLRKIKEQREPVLPDIAPTLSGIGSSCKSNGSVLNYDGRIADRSKPLASMETKSKKILLSQSSRVPKVHPEAKKRTSEDALAEPPGGKKRQKITWP